MASRTTTRTWGRRAAPARAHRAAPTRRRAAPEPTRSDLAEAARRQLRGHRGDAAGVGLLVLAALTALGLASNLAGGLGRGIADALGALVGQARYAVPAACAVAAVACVRARPPVDPDADPDAAEAGPAPLRVGLGAALLGLSVVGILHLIHGSPDVAGPVDALRAAGGYLGAASGGALGAVAGTVGAAVVLVGLGLLGALLVSGLSARRAGAGAAAAAVAALRLARGVAKPPPGPPAVGVDDATAAGADDVAVPSDLYDVERDPAPDEPGPDPTVPVAAPVRVVEEADGQMALAVARAGRAGSWTLPPPTLLARSGAAKADRRLAEAAGAVLAGALAQHGVDARLIGMTIGPTVTRYELELAPGVKVNRVTSLAHDVAYAMASPDVRILAPIPGRSAIGVEVPNRQRQLVTLGDLLATPEAAAAAEPLAVALGRDIAGRPVMLDLATLPHVLIAGATGAGKSSCINSLVTSLLMRNTPDRVRLILVDPKRVELGGYNDVPHLLTAVVTNPKKAANALDWAVREMDLRYELLADVGVRDLAGYNAAVDRGDLPTPEEPDPVTGRGYERLPYIVVVVDELNDLMMVAARDVEASICRIAQMARAVGIHLVIATQRPSVDVITGVIKANVPSRMAFSVTSLADSRVILDQSGAEKLVGQGDMLLVTASESRPRRIQAAWVDETCIHKVAAHWRRQVTEPQYVDGIAEDSAAGGRAGADADDDDELLAEAMELVVRSGLGSTSMLQRKLRVGFARAGRLMDLLERRGVVGPSEGSKARSVLMTVEEFEERPAPA
ncbi:MAG TPA: DNA translocase FtsK [Acidimicrobiia bacterium]|nr:DNA translocase FtsK [Acidimicrobiia bacterium]